MILRTDYSLVLKLGSHASKIFMFLIFIFLNMEGVYNTNFMLPQ